MKWKAVWRQAGREEILHKKIPDKRKNIDVVRRLMVMILAAAFLLASIPFPGQVTAFAAEFDVYSEKIPHGKTGKNLTISFKLQRNSGTYDEELYAGFDVSGGEIWDEDEEDRQYGYAFPFEVTKSLPTTENPKFITWG